MNADLDKIVDESINMEINTSKLYDIFRDSHTEDYKFWQQLAQEERNHASLIDGARSAFLKIGKFPKQLVAPSEHELIAVNDRLDSLISQFKISTPTRVESFNIALEIENSAGEFHYQSAMETPSESVFLRVFQEINKGEKDHICRIRAYMQENRIECKVAI